MDVIHVLTPHTCAQVVCERAVKGAAFDVSPLGSARLVAGVNAKVQVFKWDGLEPECAHHGAIIALHVR